MKSNLAKFSNTLKQSFPIVRDNILEKEIFPLDSLALESSKGRSPEDADVYYEEPIFIVDNVPMYDNPKCKFSEKGIIGIFPSVSNLVTNPEDLSQSDWSQSNTASTLTYLNFRKRRFTKVVSTTGSNTAAAIQNVAFTTSASKTVRATVKKGDQTTVTVMLYDVDATTARLQLDIDFSSQSITETVGELVEANWYNEDIVEIVGLSTSVTHTNTNRVYLYAGERGVTNSIGDYTYYTAISVYDSDQHLPYVEKGFQRNNLEYPIQWPSKGSIEFWALPQFSYDASLTYHDIIADRIGASDIGFIFRYVSSTNNQYALYITDDNGSTWDTLFFGNNGTSWSTGNAFASDDILKQWTYFKITWDDSTLTYNVYVGFEGETLTNIGSVTTSNVTTALSRNNVLKVGLGFYSDTAIYFFNGFFNDLCIKDASNSSIDDSSDHFDNNVPYEIENRIEGYNNSWILGKYGDVYFNKIKEKDKPLKFHLIPTDSRTGDINDSSITDTWELADLSSYVKKGTKAVYGYAQAYTSSANDALLLTVKGYGEASDANVKGRNWLIRIHAQLGAGNLWIGCPTVIYAPDGKFEYRRYSSSYPIDQFVFYLWGYYYEEV